MVEPSVVGRGSVAPCFRPIVGGMAVRGVSE